MRACVRAKYMKIAHGNSQLVAVRDVQQPAAHVARDQEHALGRVACRHFLVHALSSVVGELDIKQFGQASITSPVTATFLVNWSRFLARTASAGGFRGWGCMESRRDWV